MYNRFERSYFSPSTEREIIRKDNNGKIGVYAWENKLNSKIYIGSGDPLYTILSDYYQTWYMNSRDNLYIVRSIKKNSMDNFNLHILEYCSSDSLIECEQKWINLFSPEYNINPKAGSSKGYKHSMESIQKRIDSSLGKVHTEEVKSNMSKNRMGSDNPFFGENHTQETKNLLKEIANNRDYSPVKGLEVEVTDTETRITTTYSSVREAAKALNSDVKTLLRRESS
jgi:group I intron endonuclease